MAEEEIKNHGTDDFNKAKASEDPDAETNSSSLIKLSKQISVLDIFCYPSDHFSFASQRLLEHLLHFYY